MASCHCDRGQRCGQQGIVDPERALHRVGHPCTWVVANLNRLPRPCKFALRTRAAWEQATAATAAVFALYSSRTREMDLTCASATSWRLLPWPDGLSYCCWPSADRKSVVLGTSVSVRVDLCGRPV